MLPVMRNPSLAHTHIHTHRETQIPRILARVWCKSHWLGRYTTTLQKVDRNGGCIFTILFTIVELLSEHGIDNVTRLQSEIELAKTECRQLSAEECTAGLRDQS